MRNLETIESASYKKKSESWQPGDTIANTRYTLIREYNNPADTTIGASFIILNVDDTTRIHLGYDGKMRADAYYHNDASGTCAYLLCAPWHWAAHGRLCNCASVRVLNTSTPG